MEAAITEKTNNSHDDRQDGHVSRCGGRTNRQSSHSDSSGNSHKNSEDDVHYTKPLQIMGMAKKAGLLAVGSDAVLEAVRAGRAKLIVFASDTSEGTVRRAKYEAERIGVADISTTYTKFEFSRIAGRGSPGTIAFLDLGLANEFAKRLSALDNIKYEEIAGLLTAKLQVQKSNKANNRRTKV